MTARRPYEDGAGSWVAYRDEPRREWMPPGPPVRHYLYDAVRGTGMVGSPEKCVRFDTKGEALTAARDRWPTRVRGCRVGAERVGAT